MPSIVNKKFKLITLIILIFLKVTVPLDAAANELIPIDPRYVENYPVREFDELTFVKRTASGSEKTYTVPVLPNGNATFPGYGEVEVKGICTSQIKANLLKQKPLGSGEEIDVLVSYHQRRHVFLIGEIEDPGSYSIKDMTSVYDAIASAGGFTRVADKKKVKVIKQKVDGTRESFYINFPQQVFEAYDEGIGQEKYLVHEGDIIYVPPMKSKQFFYASMKVVGLAIQAVTIGLITAGISNAID